MLCAARCISARCSTASRLPGGATAAVAVASAAAAGCPAAVAHRQRVLARARTRAPLQLMFVPAHCVQRRTVQLRPQLQLPWLRLLLQRWPAAAPQGGEVARWERAAVRSGRLFGRAASSAPQPRLQARETKRRQQRPGLLRRKQQAGEGHCARWRRAGGCTRTAPSGHAAPATSRAAPVHTPCLQRPAGFGFRV